MRTQSLLAPTLLAALFLFGALLAPPAHAADSYDSCKYEITSLPTTITTQGVWCLKGDLNTAITSGAAITINANNVTLDCNHAKVGGLLAGPTTMAFGVHVLLRTSTTIRNCNVRGFYYGVYVAGSMGTLIEDNQLDSNTTSGVSINNASYGTIVRGNRIGDTGGSSAANVVAIRGYNDIHVIDNIVAGVAGDGVGDTAAIGIYVSSGTGTTTGNRISDVVPEGTGNAYGIYSSGGLGHIIDGNVVNGAGPVPAVGVICTGSTAVARNNVLVEVGSGISGCEDVDNHVTLF